MSEEMPRRAFMQNTAILAGGVATASALAGPALAQGQTQAPSQSGGGTAMSYTPKKMPFDPTRIKGMSEKLLVSHYENNYTGAVKRLNAIGEQLAALDFDKAPVFVVNGLKREELIAMNSMIMHEVYFDSLGGEGQPSGALAEAINRDFGSFAKWRSEFTAVGRALGGGSGWVLLSYSPRDKRLVNQWAADHTTNIAAGRPILIMDMYEHAYHMDYGAAAAKYVDAFMQVIRWDNVSKLYGEAQKA